RKRRRALQRGQPLRTARAARQRPAPLEGVPPADPRRVLLASRAATGASTSGIVDWGGRRRVGSALMRIRRAALALAAVSFFPASLAAQSFNLRDLLTNFFREGITLAEPPAGSPFPSHAHHFVGDASLVPLAQLN